MRTVMVGHPLNTSSVVWSVLLCGSTWVAQRCVAQSQSTAQGTDDKISDSRGGIDSEARKRCLSKSGPVIYLFDWLVRLQARNRRYRR
jgi:hypothetical protein